MKNKNQLNFPFFSGRKYPTGLPKHIKTPGVPRHSRSKIPFFKFCNDNDSAFCAVFNLAVLYLPRPLFFSLSCFSPMSLKHGSSLWQDINLVLLSVKIMLKYSFCYLVLCQQYFLSFCWGPAWRTIGRISDTSLFVKYNENLSVFWRWRSITGHHLLIKHHLKATEGSITGYSRPWLHFFFKKKS